MKQITNYFYANKLLSTKQFRFQKGLLFFDAINCLNNITNCFENSEFYSAVFKDLSKAFDCIFYDILLRKLFYYNFYPNRTKLLILSLSNRFQLVRINDKQSGTNKMDFAVPQGSIYSVQYSRSKFIICINDLPSYLSNFDTVS